MLKENEVEKISFLNVFYSQVWFKTTEIYEQAFDVISGLSNTIWNFLELVCHYYFKPYSNFSMHIELYFIYKLCLNLQRGVEDNMWFSTGEKVWVIENTRIWI